MKFFLVGRIRTHIVATGHRDSTLFLSGGLFNWLSLFHPGHYRTPLKAGSHAWRGEVVDPPNEGTEIGEGNLSQGVRVAVRQYKKPVKRRAY